MPAQRPKKRSTKSRKATPARRGFGLPGFRVLIPAALIAGGWAVMQDVGPFRQDDEPKRPKIAVSAPARPEARQRTAAIEPRGDKTARTGIVPPARPRVDVAAGSQKTPTAKPRPPASVATPMVTPTARPPTEIAAAQSRPQAEATPPGPRTIVPAGKLLYASVDANLRMQASSTSEVVAILPRGAAVKLLASRDDWHLVSTSRRLGWVHRDQLEDSTASIRRPAANLDDARSRLARK